MESTITRGSAETAVLAGSVVQSNRFKERDAREADSIVRNEAVFFSPVIRIDTDTNTAIIQYRDSQTGQVKNEFPTPKQIDSYRQSSEVGQKAAPVEAKVEAKPEVKVEPKPEAKVEAKADVKAAANADVKPVEIERVSESV